ncbi:hypothetical protein [Salmonella sp. s51933]
MEQRVIQEIKASLVFQDDQEERVQKEHRVRTQTMVGMEFRAQLV